MIGISETAMNFTVKIFDNLILGEVTGDYGPALKSQRL